MGKRTEIGTKKISSVFNEKAFEGRILNYVWINKDPFDPATAHVACGVPLHYLDEAIRNAQRYPDTTVKIWLDNKLLDDKSLALAARHIKAAGFKNVELCDLNDIEAFRKERDGIFDPRRDITEIVGAIRERAEAAGNKIPEDHSFEYQNIWGRVDLARLYVIDHCLRATQAQDVLYSDFDIGDARLGDGVAEKRLHDFGMVIGCAQPDIREGDPRIIIENSYMGFRRDRMDRQFFDGLMHITQERLKKDALNGYGPFYQQLEAWYGKKGIVFPDNMDKMCFFITKPMRTKIPMPARYEGLSLKP